MKSYEGMFLFDQAAAPDWSSMEQEVRRLCDRIQADLQVCVKFDDRKLAYEINGRKRGTYVLTYFDAPPERITDLERDARLSESILRMLVLKSEVTPEKIEELKQHPAETPLVPLQDRRDRDDDRGDRGDRGDRRRRRDESDEGRPRGRRETSGGGERSSTSDRSERSSTESSGEQRE